MKVFVDWMQAGALHIMLGPRVIGEFKGGLIWMPAAARCDAKPSMSFANKEQVTQIIRGGGA